MIKSKGLPALLQIDLSSQLLMKRTAPDNFSTKNQKLYLN